VGGRRTLVFVFLGAFFLEQAAMLVPAAKRSAFPSRVDHAVKGRRVASRLGCFACHGAEGARGIANPGGKDGVVPALAGGEMMMWAHDEAELRSWILDGRLADASGDPEREGIAAGQGSSRALVMPAYRKQLREGEIEDLLAYLRSISGLQFPDDDAVASGLERMHQLGCFRCHGAMGTGGVSNPRSLKGYVPGFGGEDYSELVRDGDELRQWIRNGASDRFAHNIIARAVLRRQAIKMPAYAGLLDDPEIEQVASAVEWLAGGEWRQKPVP